MIVLGIDPGLAIVGYGVVEEQGNRYRVLEYGCVTTSSGLSLSQRLSYIYGEMLKIIDDFSPDEMAIEELFFNQNTKTAIQVAQARGVEVLAATLRGIPIYEYTPLQIKQAITGYGRAEKKQMQLTVKTLLQLNTIPKPDDAADALAIGLTHCFSRRFKQDYQL